MYRVNPKYPCACLYFSLYMYICMLCVYYDSGQRFTVDDAEMSGPHPTPESKNTPVRAYMSLSIRIYLYFSLYVYIHVYYDSGQMHCPRCGDE